MKFVLFSLCCLLSNASISQDDLVKRVDQMLKAASMNNVPPQNNNIDADLLKINNPHMLKFQEYEKLMSQGKYDRAKDILFKTKDSIYRTMSTYNVNDPVPAMMVDDTVLTLTMHTLVRITSDTYRLTTPPSGHEVRLVPPSKSNRIAVQAFQSSQSFNPETSILTVKSKDELNCSHMLTDGRWNYCCKVHKHKKRSKNASLDTMRKECGWIPTEFLDPTQDEEQLKTLADRAEQIRQYQDEL